MNEGTLVMYAYPDNEGCHKIGRIRHVTAEIPEPYFVIWHDKHHTSGWYGADELREHTRLTRPVKHGPLMTIVPPAGVNCTRCGRGPYRSRLACFPHAIKCCWLRRS